MWGEGWRPLSGLGRRITKEVGQNGLRKHGSDLLEHDHRSLSRNNVLKGKINSPLAEQAEAPVNERTHWGF